MNAELREAVEVTDAKHALGRVLLDCDPKHVDDLVTVVFALRDQEAEIARLQAVVNRLRQAITAHLGGEQ